MDLSGPAMQDHKAAEHFLDAVLDMQVCDDEVTGFNAYKFRMKLIELLTNMAFRSKYELGCGALPWCSLRSAGVQR